MFIYLFSKLEVYVYYEQGVEPKLKANCKSFKNVISFWTETKLGIYFWVLQTEAEQQSGY